MSRLPDLDQITAFLAVAEELSFRRAAERLALDQSALSRRIKELEARLGFQLLWRTTHSVRLTDAGREFYAVNTRMIEGLAEAVARAGRIARGSAGSLRIAYMSFAALELLPRAVAAYGHAHPDVALLLSYQRTQLQRISLVQGEVDIGLMLGPFEHTELDSCEIAREPLLAIMATGHRLDTAEGEVDIAALAGEPMVAGTAQEWGQFNAIVDEALADWRIRPQRTYEAPDLAAILGLVRAGLGVALLPAVVARFLPPGLTDRPLAGTPVAVSTLAVWRRPAEEKIAALVRVLSQCRDRRTPLPAVPPGSRASPAPAVPSSAGTRD